MRRPITAIPRSSRAPSRGRSTATPMRDAERRAKQLAKALRRLGIEPGDRVGTLAWNTYRHFELYYAISGIGAVCHTINPRLFDEQIVYIVNHAEDRLLFVDTTLRAAGRAPGAALSGRCRIVPMTDRRNAATTLPALPLLRGADRGRRRRLRLARVRRAHRLLALLHLGHDRQSQGRALHPSLDRAARASASRCPTRSRSRRATSVCPVVPMFHACAGASPMPRR